MRLFFSTYPQEVVSIEDDEFWTRPETAKKLRTPQATLAAWAYKGIGPRYYVVGRRAIYRRSDVMTWLEAQADKAGTHA